MINETNTQPKLESLSQGIVTPVHDDGVEMVASQEPCKEKRNVFRRRSDLVKEVEKVHDSFLSLHGTSLVPSSTITDFVYQQHQRNEKKSIRNVLARWGKIPVQSQFGLSKHLSTFEKISQSCSSIRPPDAYVAAGDWLSLHIVDTPVFNGLFALLIVLNTIFLMLENNFTDIQFVHKIFIYGEIIFVVLFTLEIILKLISWRLSFF